MSFPPACENTHWFVPSPFIKHCPSLPHAVGGGGGCGGDGGGGLGSGGGGLGGLGGGRGGGGGAGGLGGGDGGDGGGGGDGASGQGGHAGHGGAPDGALLESPVSVVARTMKRMTRKSAKKAIVKIAFRLSAIVNPKNPRGFSRKPPNSARTSSSFFTGVSFLRTTVFCPGVSFVPGGDLGPGDSSARRDGLPAGVNAGVSRTGTLRSGSGRFGGPFLALNFDAASMVCIVTCEARGCAPVPGGVNGVGGGASIETLGDPRAPAAAALLPVQLLSLGAEGCHRLV